MGCESFRTEKPGKENTRKKKKRKKERKKTPERKTKRGKETKGIIKKSAPQVKVGVGAVENRLREKLGFPFI